MLVQNAVVIDHTGVIVSDFKKSREFYRQALASIGYALLAEFPTSVTGGVDVAGFGKPPKPDFWVTAGTPNHPPIHIAFRVGSRQLVDAFYRARQQQASNINDGNRQQTTHCRHCNQ